jgi:NAD(P)-dependent dehydrogenase (short-subunit alcohol dehydrogenase family)
LRRLEGKAALVTGGGTGIGAAIARLFLEEGARVMICGRRGEVVRARAEEWRAEGFDAHAVACDIAEDATATIEAAVSAFGQLDLLVNNAALSSGAPMGEMDMASWRRVLSVNLDAAFELVSQALPWLAQGRGAILHISSISAVAGEFDDVAYAASKAGLEGFSRKLALEVAPLGVRSNVIRPGLVVTESFGAMPQDFFDSQLPLIPLRRLGKPEDIAEAALFLCSNAASFITGAILTVDGGESAK